MTRYAKLKVETEIARIAHEVKELAGVVQSFGSRGASISSGPFETDAMADGGVTARNELESVVLVDANNNVVGSCGKLAAHRDGRLHRAFSILITNPDGALLLQRRAPHKYHFANRWSNACCGHPRPGESTPAAARRRLAEELGFSVPLTHVAAFRYRARDAVSGLVEHEFLHVFHGLYTGEPDPNPDEIGACRWMLPDRVRRGLAARPAWFTPWFALLTVRSRVGELRLVND